MTHVLLVDDEVIILLSLANFLERKGLRVSIAHDGLQALERYLAEPADVVVTDMRMPRMGGGELTTRLRELRPDLPVLVVTGYSGQLEQVEAFSPPVQVMTKPVDPIEVLTAIRALA